MLHSVILKEPAFNPPLGGRGASCTAYHWGSLIVL